MRTDLDHLPLRKRNELERIVAILFEEFGEALSEATGKRKAGRILKIILFGSHARGDWVDAPSSANAYMSDYDLLVIVNQSELADRATYWDKAEEHLAREVIVTESIRSPISFIVHSLQQVNDGLAHGRVFFMEIAREGIVLYQSSDKPLHEPKPKTPEQALSTARHYFATDLARAQQFYDSFEFSLSKSHLNVAAFALHQATEQLYHGLLLTLTFYTPYNHNIAFLRSQAERLDRDLFTVWPRGTRRERAVFQKLKEAYVKARYSDHYKITPEELRWLGDRVQDLAGRIHSLCTARIAELEAAVEDHANRSD